MDLYDVAVARKLSSGGGGGSSDFSTATITAEGSGLTVFTGATIDEDGLATSSFIRLVIPLSPTGTVILYKGKAFLELAEGVSKPTIPAGENNIYYDNEIGMYVVTGDCTITIS